MELCFGSWSPEVFSACWSVLPFRVESPQRPLRICLLVMLTILGCQLALHGTPLLTVHASVR